jgi:hypothetical protein
MNLAQLTRLLKSLISTLESIQRSVDSIDRKSYSGQGPANPKPQDVVVSSVALPPAVDGYYASEQKERPSKNRKDSLRLIFEGLGLIIAGLLAWSAYRTLGQIQTQTAAMNRQVGVMQKQLDTTDRPWIKVDIGPNTDWVPGAIIGGPLSFEQNGSGGLTVKIVMNNIGRSVATLVESRIEVIPMSPFDPKFRLPIDKQRELCNRTLSHTVVDTRYAIFPGTKKEEFVRLSFSTSNIPPPPQNLKRGKPVSLIVYGCVDYYFASVAHQTGFIYQVYGGPRHEGIQIKDTVPVSRLTFEPYPFGGEYAN